MQLVHRHLFRAPLALGLFALVSLSIGCGPSWTVVKQASPNPLAGQKAFSVEPVKFEGVTVGKKAEQEYLGEKKPEEVQAWHANKERLAASFGGTLGAEAPKQGFTAQNAPAPFAIRANVTWLEPGFYAAVVNAPTEVKMTVQIVSAEGAVVDEFQIHRKVHIKAIMGVPTNAGVGDRMSEAGVLCARLVLQYLKARTGG